VLNLLSLTAALASPSSAYPTGEVLQAFEQACGELTAPVVASSRAESFSWLRIEITKPDSEMVATVRSMEASAKPLRGMIRDQQVLTRLVAGRPLFLMYYRMELGTNSSNECRMFDFNSDLSLPRDEAERWMNHPPQSYIVGTNGMWEMDWLPGRTQSQSIMTIAYLPSSDGEVRRSIQLFASDNPALRAAVLGSTTKH
jgi:hypothetical protein